MIIVNGNEEPSSIKVGSKDVQAVYSGSQLVWPKHPYNPRNLELVSIIDVPGPTGGRDGTCNSLCIDNPNRWLLFDYYENRDAWYYSDDQGSTWIPNNNKPDGWDTAAAQPRPDVFGVSWNGSIWLAWGYACLVMWSADGLNWEIINQQELWDFFNKTTTQVHFCAAAPRADGSWWVYGKVNPPLPEDQDYPIAIRVFPQRNHPTKWENMPSGAPINPDNWNDRTKASYAATGPEGTPQNDYVCVNWFSTSDDTRNKFTHRDHTVDMELVRRSDEGFQSDIMYHSVDGWSGFIARSEDVLEFSESNQNWNKNQVPISSGKNPYAMRHIAANKETGQVFLMGYSREGPYLEEHYLLHLYMWHPQTGIEKTGWCQTARDLGQDPDRNTGPYYIYSQGNRFIIQTWEPSRKKTATYVYKWKQP